MVLLGVEACLVYDVFDGAAAVTRELTIALGRLEDGKSGAGDGLGSGRAPIVFTHVYLAHRRLVVVVSACVVDCG